MAAATGTTRTEAIHTINKRPIHILSNQHNQADMEQDRSRETMGKRKMQDTVSWFTSFEDRTIFDEN
ncbi:MAG: hypothetical protein Q9213_005683 [Squamulea squamosa]